MQHYDETEEVRNRCVCLLTTGLYLYYVVKAYFLAEYFGDVSRRLKGTFAVRLDWEKTIASVFLCNILFRFLVVLRCISF